MNELGYGLVGALVGGCLVLWWQLARSWWWRHVEKRLGKPLVVYLGGPMTGYQLLNFPAFAIATLHLRSLGFVVISPAEHDLEEGLDPARPMEEQGFDLKGALRWDLEQVLKADLVIMQDGWQASVGCNIEVNTAKACGIPVTEYKNLLAKLMEDAGV